MCLFTDAPELAHRFGKYPQETYTFPVQRQKTVGSDFFFKEHPKSYPALRGINM